MVRQTGGKIIWGDVGESNRGESSNVDGAHEIEALKIPQPMPERTLLRKSTYEELVTEIARRNLDAQDEATFELLKKTYSILKQIGKGSSGVVHLVYHKDLCKYFACKVIEKSGPINDIQSMKTEIEIMKRVKHPRVVSLHQLFETPKCMWLILELVESGGLRSKLSSMKRRFPEILSAKITKQMLEGLQYLHNQGIVHRDLKIDNILFEGNVQTGSVKIADFGLSALLTGDKSYPSDNLERKKFKGLKSAWGTPTHYSPELIAGAYGPQTDMWSLGCVLYEMLTGFNAFPPSSNRGDPFKHKDLFRRIKSCNYRRTNLIHTSPQCKDFISKLLELDPAIRMSPEEALKHQWIIQTCPHEETGKDRSKHRNINLLKMLSCLRSQDSVVDPTKMTKNANGKVSSHSCKNNSIIVNAKNTKNKDVHGKETTVIVVSVDSNGQRLKTKKSTYMNLSDLSLSSTSKSSIASKASTPCHRTRHANMYPINFDHPSPERVLEKRKSAGKGFFNSFYLSVLKSDTSKSSNVGNA